MMRAACALALALCAASAAQAQSKAAVTAVLDMRVIHGNSIAGKTWQEYFNTRRKEFKDRIAAEEKSLRSAWDELNRQRSILSPEAFQARERTFKEMEAAANGRAQVLDQQLSREVRATRAEFDKAVEDALEPILESVIKAKGIDIILKREGVFFSRKEFDITSDVLARLDKAMPRVDIKALAAKAKKADKK